MSSNPPVCLLDRRDHVATLTLDRPDVLNSLDIATLDQLGRHLATIHGDGDLRAILIRGKGRAFCAGGDLSTLCDAGDRRGDGFRHGAGLFHQVILALRSAPQPVIAAVHGVAAGGGMSLALACDFRIMAEDTFMQAAYLGRGFSPDGGLSHFLPRLVGPSVALEILATDRRLPAAECARLGLANRVCPADEVPAVAAELAAEISRGPKGALARCKSLIDESLHRGLAAQLEAERIAIAACADSPEGEEGLSAFAEKRPPDFLAATSR